MSRETAECESIIVADGGIRCEHCGETFDPTEAMTATFPGLPDLYQCPNCAEWTEGPPPGDGDV